MSKSKSAAPSDIDAQSKAKSSPVSAPLSPNSGELSGSEGIKTAVNKTARDYFADALPKLRSAMAMLGEARRLAADDTATTAFRASQLLVKQIDEALARASWQR